MNIKIKDIIEVIDVVSVSANPEEKIAGFSIDSRTISPGEIFIAISGDNFDGHDFAREALKKGAISVIIEKDIVTAGAHCITVKDTREAMGQIASFIRSQVKIPVISITGTNGKTTVKDIMAHLLEGKYSVLKNNKSFNNLIGVSLTLFDLDDSYELAILELGTNHPGEIEQLARIALPTHCVLTCIGDGHLEFFVNRKNVFNEKKTLLNFLPEEGAAFINKDDEMLKTLAGRKQNIKFYGKDKSSDFILDKIQLTEGGSFFQLNGEEYFLPLEGEHNVYNAACCMAVCEEFGVDTEQVKQRLKTVKAPSMRLQAVNVRDIVFLNDSYNANPDSFISAVDVLRRRPERGKKGIVAGDMLELGDGSRKMHEKVGRYIAGGGVDFLIVHGNLASGIAFGAIEAGMGQENVRIVKSHEEAAKELNQFAGSGAVVLLKGSRASNMEEVLECFTTFCTH